MIRAAALSTLLVAWGVRELLRLGLWERAT